MPTPGVPTPLEAVSAYYSDKLRRFGPTPLGVDWPSRPNLELRLVQLLKLCDFSQPRSLNDVGCGYGALRTLLSRRHRRAQIDLLGTDVSAAMVAAARRRWRHRADCAFELAEGAVRVADYSLASGIFNVKLDCPVPEWEALVARTLENLHRHSRLGYAVNFIGPAAPGQNSPPELYRPAPERWLMHIADTQPGAEVTVLRGYGLPEYTLLVRPAG
ncbi:methyltransferase domain-containing protein [Ottowia testudinis]|uniref:Methyltransferase domain-containing protein n=1 Tax=Ottowia testudinis TaxID=2816950 RepID=A0A975CHS9_9BURK|nr:methyltransferase domain-containing protein [Ottowia testudinis]QTD45172.1 methyltransferase domain-containing protein [Ottowia testudinis]